MSYNHALLSLSDLHRSLRADEAKRIILPLVDQPMVTDWSNKVPKLGGKGKARHQQRYFWPVLSSAGVVTSPHPEDHVRWLLLQIRCDKEHIQKNTGLSRHLQITFYWHDEIGKGDPLPEYLHERLQEWGIWYHCEYHD